MPEVSPAVVKQPWERKAVDNRLENKILTGMIVDSRFLGQIQPMYDPRFFKTSFAAQVASWCLDYWDRYKLAPLTYIQDVYEDQRRAGMDEDQAELIGRFLAGLSEEFEKSPEQLNTQYLLDQTEAYFKERGLELTAQDITACLRMGRVDQAEEAALGFHSVSRATSSTKKLLEDAKELLDSEENEPPLLALNGDLGRWMGPLYRDWLVSLAAPKKRGKSWWLGWFALQALYSGLKVGYFNLEMPSSKTAWRMLRELAGVTHKTGERLWPVWDCASNQDGSCTNPDRTNDLALTDSKGKIVHYKYAPPGYLPCTSCWKTKEYRAASWLEPRDIQQDSPYNKAIRKAMVARQYSHSDIWMEAWWQGTPELIRSTLYKWEHLEGFQPDVIVVDYADALTSENKFGGQKRHEIDAVWKGLKGLAMEKHALVLTATHTNKQSEGQWSVKGTDYAEDNRKGWHVDLMVGINQSPIEEGYQRWRLGKTDERHDGTGEGQVTCLCQLDYGQVVLDSYWY
uniref:Putative helicase n=1 Tax=viral metagenome TaxID=1070528 RepID=A0A6M3XN98_9ZZZZ